MSKAVLISIKPKWCELIASGKKSVEVRKTKPKIETPFKCYIYCTQGDALAMPCLNNPKYAIHRMNNGTIEGRQMTAQERNQSDYLYANGKVIGEFVCDKIITLRYSCGSYRCEGLNRVENDRIASASQLSLYDMRNYLSCNGGYAWHISDLVIYDKPKELIEFKPPCDGFDKRCQVSCALITINGKSRCTRRQLTRPPQSWCYVEEVGQ